MCTESSSAVGEKPTMPLETKRVRQNRRGWAIDNPRDRLSGGWSLEASLEQLTVRASLKL